jgi:hypothetical protein
MTAGTHPAGTTEDTADQEVRAQMIQFRSYDTRGEIGATVGAVAA